MTPQEVTYKVDLRLNKQFGEDYDNIECSETVEAVNKGQLEWIRRQLHGINQTREGDEESKRRVDDLQPLIKNKRLSLTNKAILAESELLPDDYGWFKSIIVYGEQENGCGKSIIEDLHHIEVANVNEWLSDWAKEPSFEYRQAFYTLSGNRIQVYTNGEFKVSSIELVYYRQPQSFDIAGCPKYDDSVGSDKDLEFKRDVCELIIDEAASIIAADIEHLAAYEVTKRRNENNN
jgi:hypothetical protein